MKDDKTKIVVNTNSGQLKQYYAGKQKVIREGTLENTVKKLQDDIADLKIMLNLLIHREGK